MPNTFYGFAQISVVRIDAASNQLDLTIGTVGYNNMAGQPIQIALAASPVPEPGSLALVGAGGLGFLLVRRRRTQNKAA